MSKKLKDLKWQSVPLEGFPSSMTGKFDGFAGLEECTSYGLDREKLSKNKKKAKKRKDKSKKKEVPIKKVKLDSPVKSPNTKLKLSNGFIVESCNSSTTPSQTNEVIQNNTKTHKNKTQLDKLTLNKEQPNKSHSKMEQKKTHSEKKEKKIKLGEDVGSKDSNLTREDMLTWAEFKLQEPIVRALMELGFQRPTQIQQLTLPAAIHGRRDILGAAETGSGKTLAFGLPILSGILKLKEKAQAKGLDVYDIPYRKLTKKANAQNDKNNIIKTATNKSNKKIKDKAKESPEDGYGSDENLESNEKSKPKLSKKERIKSILKSDDDDFIEEYDVPIRKRDSSVDEGNDSDSDNYIHLSEMLDSDDMPDSSDSERDDSENEQTGTGDEHDDSENEQVDSENEESDSENEKTDSETEQIESEPEQNEQTESEEESGVENDAEIDENINTNGIGCVKVVDNIEIPGPVVTKTGKPMYALILTPTRELAIQISRHLIAAAKYTGIKIATIVGGMAAVKQERVLRSGPEVVVATPGRLWELITQGQTHLCQLGSVKFLAIDETDRMIERGHFEELQPLLERLNLDEASKESRQNFVFSATLTLVHDLPIHMKGKKVTKNGKIINRKIEKMTPQQKIKRLVDMIGMTEPKVVDITTQNSGTSEKLTECRISCSMEHKDSYLYYLLKRHPGRTLVFCNSIGSVRRLAQLLTILKCRPLPLHASMPQRQRLKNLERFRDDPFGVLIATDVAARGLDIPQVDHVIQYQVPRTAENYVHRSGRTARAGAEGVNVLMVEPGEAHLYTKICRTLNKTSEVPTFPVEGHMLAPMREMVNLARELDALELKKRRAAQAHGWREKAAHDLDIIIDEDDIPIQKLDPTIERALKAKRKQLDAMLSRPMFPKGFSFKYPTLNDPNALRVSDDNALQVMKKALESGELKREKRKSKNAPLLKLGKGGSKHKFKRRKGKK